MNIIKIEPTSENITPVINAALESIKDDCETIIEFAKGTYYFRKNGSFRGMFYPSNNQSCERSVVFPIIGKKNLTIDGNDSDFIFCDRVQPFVIQNSTNIKLENFKIDFSFLRYAFGTVSSVCDDGFEIKIDRTKFDYVVEDGHLAFIAGEDKISTKSRKISIKGIAPKRGTRFLYSANTNAKVNTAVPSIVAVVSENTDGVYFKYCESSHKPEYQVGDILCLAYDNERDTGVFFAEFSQSIYFDEISIYRGSGMGIIAQMCSDIFVDTLKIALKEGREEYFTTTADAVHMVNCAGKLEIKNSTITKSYDDALNVHGNYFFVSKVISDRIVEIECRHHEQTGLIPCLKGDRISVNDSNTMNEVGIVTVEDINYDQNRERIMVIFQENINGFISEGDIFENIDRAPDLIVENCIITDCPRMLVSSSKKAFIRNNILALNSSDIRIYDSLQYWYESGAVGTVVIADNKFINPANNTNIVIGSNRPANSNRLHEEVYIIDNYFRNEKENAIKVSRVKKLVENNNKFGTDV